MENDKKGMGRFTKKTPDSTMLKLKLIFRFSAHSTDFHEIFTFF